MSAPRRTIFIVVVIFLAGGLRAQSFLERYGFGQVQPEADVVGQGMGGITVIPMDFKSSHFSQPASWHRVRQTRLQIGLTHDGIEVDGGASYRRAIAWIWPCKWAGGRPPPESVRRDS